MFIKDLMSSWFDTFCLFLQSSQNTHHERILLVFIKALLFVSLDTAIAVDHAKPQPSVPHQPVRVASIKNIVFDLNDVLVRKGRHGVREPMDGMADIIRRLHQQGFKLYILSDSSTRFWERMRVRFDFLKHFDGAVLSSAVGFAKPCVQMYTTLLATYALKPEECFFIDDDQSNVNGAYLVGMDGIRFVSARQLEAALQQLQILK